jgi:hypothetical protein
MIGWLAGIVVLMGGTVTAQGASLCRDAEIAQKFSNFADVSTDHTPGGLQDAFGAHLGSLRECLTQWVEDGGERDGLPLTRGVTRESYRLGALRLLGLLYPKNAGVASWVSRNMRSWPESLQTQALATLGDIGGEESFVVLRAEVRTAEGKRKEMIWNFLLFVDGRRFAAELESIAPTHEDQVLVGAMLMAVNQPVALPALRKLRTLVPEKTGVYAEQIREIEKQDLGGRDHAN